MTKLLIKRYLLVLLILFLMIFVYKINFQKNKLSAYENKKNEVPKQDLKIEYNETSLTENDTNNSDLNNFIDCYKQPINKDAFTEDMNKKYNEIEALFSNSSEAVSFSYEDLYTGLHISYNETHSYFAASTIKAAVVIYIYEMYLKGEINLDEVMTYTINYYVEGSGSIQYASEGSQYTIKELIRKAIVESDNIAYQMLSSRVYNTDIREYWSNLGATTFWKSNSIWSSGNSKDGAIYMKQIYKFTENHPELKTEILSLFYNSVARSITLKDNSILIAHKSGWNSANIHDLAIIYNKQPYILTINSLKGYTDYESFFYKASNLINEFHVLYWQNKSNYCYQNIFNS